MESLNLAEYSGVSGSNNGSSNPMSSSGDSANDSNDSRNLLGQSEILIDDADTDTNHSSGDTSNKVEDDDSNHIVPIKDKVLVLPPNIIDLSQLNIEIAVSRAKDLQIELDDARASLNDLILEIGWFKLLYL